MIDPTLGTPPTPASTTILDLETGLEILARLPLADPHRAHSELNHFFDGLLQAPPQVGVYIEPLEQSRETLCFVGEELARSYVNKPLPLTEAPENCFRRVTSTWLKAARG